MPLAARVGDQTAHPGVVAGPGEPTVLIEGLPAARTTDTHTCSIPPPTGPHSPTTFSRGSQTVSIGGASALRLGDQSGCGSPVISSAQRVVIG
jgi:uncharacterized Zn-binding protein involved in type VI secretion